MDAFKSLWENWVRAESLAYLWLAISAVSLLGVTFTHQHKDDGQIPAFGWRLSLSLARVLGFVGLLVMFPFLLRSAYMAFEKVNGSFLIGGSLSNVGWQEWRDRYGGHVTQQDLRVSQYVPVETVEAIPPADTSQPTLYRHVTVEQPVLQSSIQRFRSTVGINLVAPVQRTDTYGAYKLSALYEYLIINPSDDTTRAEFQFPLSKDTLLFDDIQVSVDGQEFTGYQVISETLTWDRSLMPGEQIAIAVQYDATGMDWFVFESTEPREINDFNLAVTVDTHSCCISTNPDNGSIQLDIQAEPTYQVITWTISQAIVAPRLGMSLRQHWAYAPYHAMIVTLPYAPRGFILCFSLVMLTFLLCRAPVRLRQIALLACLFALPYLILMAGGLPAPSSIPPDQLAQYQVNLLPVISLILLGLAFMVLRGQARLPMLLVLAIFTLFMAGYPFIGLLPDEQKRNTYEGIIQVVMLAYLFLLVLWMRVRGAKQAIAA
jgi:hypothetical protein